MGNFEAFVTVQHPEDLAKPEALYRFRSKWLIKEAIHFAVQSYWKTRVAKKRKKTTTQQLKENSNL